MRGVCQSFRRFHRVENSGCAQALTESVKGALGCGQNPPKQIILSTTGDYYGSVAGCTETTHWLRIRLPTGRGARAVREGAGLPCAAGREGFDASAGFGATAPLPDVCPEPGRAGGERPGR